MSPTSRIRLAPADGGVAECTEMFQTKYRNQTHEQGNEDNWEVVTDEGSITTRGRSVACILPSGWAKRLKKSGPVYSYTPSEIVTYNELLRYKGKLAAKQWADGRFHDRCIIT